MNSNYYCFIEYFEYDDDLEEVERDESGANGIFRAPAPSKGILSNSDYS